MNNNEKYKKYLMYFEPIVVVNMDFIIIYKNPSAHAYLPKLRKGINIRNVLNIEDKIKMKSTIETENLSVIDVDIPPPFIRCIANIDEVEETNEDGWTICEKVIVLTFFSSINFFKCHTNHHNSLLNLIGSYNMKCEK